MQPLKPALQSSQGRSFNWSGANLVNCFAEKADGDKREDFALITSPGLTVFSNVGSGPVRGGVECAGLLYVVSGNTLYRVTDAGVATALGSIDGTGPVSMASNGVEVAIAAADNGYVWSENALTIPCPFKCSDVTYIDSYILWTVPDSDEFFISDSNNAMVYDAADIANVEGSPDRIVGVITDHREVQFFGERTIEIFYNSGAAAFPIERQGNAFIERGCIDRDSIVKMDNSVYFVGDDRLVYTMAGYRPQRVSTHAIEYHLRESSYYRAFTYGQEGHKFYCVEVDQGTYCYDVATGAWHQRKSSGMDHWRVWGGIAAFDKVLLFDRALGRIYEPSLDVFEENGASIPVGITLPTMEFGRARVTMYAFEVTIETGPGDAGTPDPQIILAYSDDGGHRWSNEMARSMGRVGEYRQRSIWRKLGQFRTRQMRLQMPDPVRRLVISYWAEIT